MHERRLGAACIYPERAYLERVADRHQYQGRPYTLALALGDAELSHRAFEHTARALLRVQSGHWETCETDAARSIIHTSGLLTVGLKKAKN